MRDPPVQPVTPTVKDRVCAGGNGLAAVSLLTEQLQKGPEQLRRKPGNTAGRRALVTERVGAGPPGTEADGRTDEPQNLPGEQSTQSSLARKEGVRPVPIPDLLCKRPQEVQTRD